MTKDPITAGIAATAAATPLIVQVNYYMEFLAYLVAIISGVVVLYNTYKKWKNKTKL